jgi:hypothetical protein
VTTAFLAQQAALVVALQAQPSLSGVSVLANRVRALAREENQAVLVRLGSTEEEGGPLGCTDWATTFEIESIARAASGADPAAAVDPLLAAVWEAVRGLTLPDVLDTTASPQIDWVFDAADTPLASAVLRLTVRHRTQADTLTPWSA